jgi:hypothetical protein
VTARWIRLYQKGVAQDSDGAAREDDAVLGGADGHDTSARRHPPGTERVALQPPLPVGAEAEQCADPMTGSSSTPTAGAGKGCVAGAVHLCNRRESAEIKAVRLAEQKGGL